MSDFLYFFGGVLATVIFGWIYYYMSKKDNENNKKNMQKKVIVHVFSSCFDVGQGLSFKFPEFKLTYNNNVLTKSVIVIGGRFENTGDIDINIPTNDKAIGIILPPDCNIKGFNAVPSTNELKVTTSLEHDNRDETKSESKDTTINNRANIFINNDLFKCKEKIEYELILETNKRENEIQKNTNFSLRFENTTLELLDENEFYERNYQEYRKKFVVYKEKRRLKQNAWGVLITLIVITILYLNDLGIILSRPIFNNANYLYLSIGAYFSFFVIFLVRVIFSTFTIIKKLVTT